MNGPDDKPLLVLSRVDKGRVALLLSDQMWLWARGYDGGGPYLDLLRRLAHWLMKEPELEEEALRASAKGREITIERQSVSGQERETDLVAPDGAKTRARARTCRAGPQPRASQGRSLRTLPGRGRRACRAGQCRSRESAGDAGRRFDDGETASDRRSDRGNGAPPGLGRRRFDRDAAACRPQSGRRATAAPTISGSSGRVRARRSGLALSRSRPASSAWRCCSARPWRPGSRKAAGCAEGKRRIRRG